MPHAFWVLFFGTLLNRLGAVVLPMLSIYLSRHRHVPATEIGLVLTLYGAGALCAAPTGGWLADRFGRRRVLVGALASGAVAMAALGFARSLPAIAVTTCALGFFGELYRPVVHAALSDVIPEDKRTLAYGYLHWAINLGFAIAAASAGWLAEHDVRLLFVIDAATTLGFAGLVAWRVPETQAEHHRMTSGSALAPLRNRPFVVFLVGTLLFGMIFQQFVVALPLDLLSRGIGPTDYGLVIALNGVLIVLLQPIFARNAQRFDVRDVMVVGVLLSGIGFALHGFLLGIAGTAVAVAVWTLGEIATSPVIPTLVAGAAPGNERGRYQGALAMTFATGTMVAPLAGNSVLSAFGGRTLWLGCLGLSVVAALCYVVAVPALRAKTIAA